MSEQGWAAPGDDAGRQDPPQPPPPSPAPSPERYVPAPPVWAQPEPDAWQQPRQTQQTQQPRQPQFQPPGQLDFRPGVIALRPQTMNDLFGGVFRAVRGNVAATVGLAAVTSLIFLVPFTALGAWVSTQDDTVLFDESITRETGGLMGLIGSTIPSFGSWFSSILLTGFIAYVIGQAVLGRKVGASETWRGTIRRVWALIGATLVTVLIYLAALAVILGVPIGLLVAGATSDNGGTLAAGVGLLILAMFLAVVVMIFLWTRLAFVTSSVILEDLGVGRAFARSWRLTGGTPFWRILGIRLLTVLGLIIVGWIIALPLSILGGTLGAMGVPLEQTYVWQAVIAGISGVISGAITTPITAGLDALLYVDQRIRREGLDVQLIQTAQGVAPSPWPRAEA